MSSDVASVRPGNSAFSHRNENSSISELNRPDADTYDRLAVTEIRVR